MYHMKSFMIVKMEIIYINSHRFVDFPIGWDMMGYGLYRSFFLPSAWKEEDAYILGITEMTHITNASLLMGFES